MTTTPRCYLDHAATAPILPAAQQAWAQTAQHWANPASPHADGRSAQSLLEHARQQIAERLQWDGHIIFTGGATEALEIAISRCKLPRRLLSAVEHDAVLRHASGEAIAVDSLGRIRADDLLAKLDTSSSPALVAIQSVNNETGVIQDLAGLGAIVRQRGGLLLADCAQSVAKLPLPDADMIVLSGHKFGAPPGVGALLIRDLKHLHAVGGQEQGYRPGTHNLPAIVALAAALQVPVNWLDRAGELRDQLDHAITALGGEVVSLRANRLPTIASYRMPGVAANVQLIKFDMAGYAVSAGAACSSGTLKPSHVLAAMGMEADAAAQVIRVSIGRSTTRAQIFGFIDQWKAIASASRG
ncbi:MAG: aminotransferase class V-fold PLP-dependent enzyme [Parasphingorhabdus sp.]|nr:aminotransferase class V-fold PLP-dependent enzyme [Parasphingorhabdus sp.]